MVSIFSHDFQLGASCLYPHTVHILMSSHRLNWDVKWPVSIVSPHMSSDLSVLSRLVMQSHPAMPPPHQVVCSCTNCRCHTFIHGKLVSLNTRTAHLPRGVVILLHIRLSSNYLFFIAVPRWSLLTHNWQKATDCGSGRKRGYQSGDQ